MSVPLKCVFIFHFLEKRKQYEDDGLINDNESDAEAGSALKKQRKPKKKRGNTII